MQISGIVDAVRGDPRTSSRRLQLVLALLVLNLADVALTRAVIDRGGYEVNPLMRNLMEGFAAPVGLKLAVVALAGGLLLCCPANSRVADPAVRIVVGVYSALVLWNAALLVWLAV